ncbi:unnamed protein product [Mytilus edulis]|uniref:B box-type domain-containing protein n=1 Tax=Mytilus edulis TaxID=6550 RepID=A0A8S3SI64_MYTED|nr:unnamed protein product [Mytilus edulis]
MASNHLCQPCETEDTFVLAIKWCTECEENLCKECFQFHRKDVAAKHVHSSALVSDVVKDLELSVVSFCSIETAIGKALREVDDQNIASNQSITTIKTRLQNQLAKSASVLSQEIDIICTEHRLRLQEQDHSFTESKTMYTKRQQELEKVLKHGSNNQVFIMAHQMKILLRKEEAAFINNCNKLNNIKIHFPEDQHISSIPSLDDISIEKYL